MTNPARTFAVASDEALVGLISRARSRLVVIAPALTKPVADAVSRRLDDLGQLSVTVILDADPEVYRLGFGDQEALDAIRAASAKNLFDLREQPGVRIGVVISDTTTMIYSRIPAADRRCRPRRRRGAARDRRGWRPAIAHVLIPGGVGIGQELAWLRKFDSGIAS